MKVARQSNRESHRRNVTTSPPCHRPSGDRGLGVFAESLKYSKGVAVGNQSVPEFPSARVQSRPDMTVATWLAHRGTVSHA